jgi:flavin reductase (DIM6/NTAB) family NADH-FMN oxidoreductase RutF
MYLSKTDIENTPKVERLKLINSISGIKSANLIGSISEDGITNLAVFSSVVHIGSNPAMLGFILRPNADVNRNTYDNIKETGVYTINHIHTSFTQKAHYTSAKFDKEVSEFEKCGLTEEYVESFIAPFVKESPVQIGLSFKEALHIESNGTILIIGQVEHLVYPEESIDEKGYMDLSKLGAVGIGGLNSYYDLHGRRDYPYARVSELPDFNE